MLLCTMFGSPPVLCTMFGSPPVLCTMFGLPPVLCTMFGLPPVLCTMFGSPPVLCTMFGSPPVLCTMFGYLNMDSILATRRSPFETLDNKMAKIYKIRFVHYVLIFQQCCAPCFFSQGMCFVLYVWASTDVSINNSIVFISADKQK